MCVCVGGGGGITHPFLSSTDHDGVALPTHAIVYPCTITMYFFFDLIVCCMIVCFRVSFSWRHAQYLLSYISG